MNNKPTGEVWDELVDDFVRLNRLSPDIAWRIKDGLIPLAIAAYKRSTPPQPKPVDPKDICAYCIGVSMKEPKPETEPEIPLKPENWDEWNKDKQWGYLRGLAVGRVHAAPKNQDTETEYVSVCSAHQIPETGCRLCYVPAEPKKPDTEPEKVGFSCLVKPAKDGLLTFPTSIYLKADQWYRVTVQPDAPKNQDTEMEWVDQKIDEYFKGLIVIPDPQATKESLKKFIKGQYSCGPGWHDSLEEAARCGNHHAAPKNQDTEPKRRGSYRGKNLEEMTREELMDAVEHMGRLYTSALDQHMQDLSNLHL